MWLIVGLGNPGKQYAQNRHNVGFRIVDFLTRFYEFPSFQEKGKKALTEGQIGAVRLRVVKPLAFMNLSGPPVAEVMNFYKIPPKQVVVIYDDLDLVPGKVRLKLGGGNGGHNGLKSLDGCLGSNYWRLRVGIGHPGDREMVTGYVLSNFISRDKEWLVPLEEKIAKHFPLILENQMELFVTKVMQP